MNDGVSAKMKVVRSIAAVTVLAFLYLPLAVVIVYSFNTFRFGTTWGGFTTKWYTELFNNDEILTAAKNSILLACSSTVVSTLIGTFLAYGMFNSSKRLVALCEKLLIIPMVVPDIIMAVSLLGLYMVLRYFSAFFELGRGAMLCSHVTFQVPVVTLVVMAGLKTLPRNIFEAAHDLGASSISALRYIALPLLLPSIIAGALLAFVLSLDDFVVSFFTSGPGSTTLPIYIYSSVKRGLTPQINALSSVMIGLTVIIVIGLNRLNSQKWMNNETV